MERRVWGGIALLALAGLMFIGFLGSAIAIGSPAAIGALLLTVVLPGAAGIALIRGIGGGNRARTEKLRQMTIDAEVMKLAVSQAGKLTAIEVSTALALPPEAAKAHLDAMVERDIADIEITDHGTIVYTFQDAKHVGDKATSRGILDA
jgi:hypothetical protein